LRKQTEQITKLEEKVKDYDELKEEYDVLNALFEEDQ